jgi:hypothetical protein
MWVAKFCSMQIVDPWAAREEVKCFDLGIKFVSASYTHCGHYALHWIAPSTERK